MKAVAIFMALILSSQLAWARAHKASAVRVESDPEASALPVPVASQPVTIKEAVDTALANNPGLRESREKVNQADADVTLAISQIFPTISGTLGAQYRKDALNLGNPLFGGEPYNEYAFGVSANQPLWDGGAVLGGLAVQKKEKQLRELEANEMARDLSVQVIEAFYTILLNEKQLEVYEKSQRIQTDLLAYSQRRLRIGRAQLFEVLQIRTSLAQLVPQIAQAKNLMRTAAVQLATLMGQARGTEVAIRGSIEPFDWGLVEKKLDEKPGTIYELQHAEVAYDEISDKRQVTMAPHYPQVAAQGTWGRQAFTKEDLFNDYSTSWTVGLNVTIPIFSGLSSVQQRKDLNSQEKQLDFDRANIAVTSSQNLATTHKDVVYEHQVLASAKVAADLADQSLNEAARQYRLHLTDLLPYLQSQTAYLTAQNTFNQAKYDYIDTTAKYFSASGKDVNTVVQWLEEK